jgi:hypothetical protein
LSHKVYYREYKVSEVEILPGYLPACIGTDGYDFAVAKLEDFKM